jgi:T-lymphoma invasion and metastasis-inducing protein 1
MYCVVMPEEITAHRSDIDKNCDPGTKSEGEEEVQSKGKATLGRTPNHLSLSTTSTLSAGSTGSQARLIQSSHQPENYQPTTVKDLGKPTCMQCYLSGNYKTT